MHAAREEHLFGHVKLPWMSTYCPGTKWAAVRGVPGGRRASGDTLNSARWRLLGRPAAAKWPRKLQMEHTVSDNAGLWPIQGKEVILTDKFQTLASDDASWTTIASMPHTCSEAVYLSLIQCQAEDYRSLLFLMSLLGQPANMLYVLAEMVIRVFWTARLCAIY